MLPELRPEDWVRLDLSDARVIARYLRVQGDLGETEVPVALLDTGSALPLLAPAREIAEIVDLSQCPPSQVFTAGGPVDTRQLVATVSLGLWRFSALEVHASGSFDRWVVGMPILKHFNLMFKDPVAHRPILWGPTLRSFDGARWL